MLVNGQARFHESILTMNSKFLNFSGRSLALTCLTFGSTGLPLAWAAPDPMIEKGMSFAPRQSDVVIEKVASADLEKCQKRLDKRNNIPGMLIVGPNNQPLRWFGDSNNDRDFDIWSYYNNGVEVYRDIDTDFNRKVDQCRWFGTAGTRWGLDKNEDGDIDRWKSISAEEVTSEVVAAVRENDPARFTRVILNDEDIAALELGPDKHDDLIGRSEAAADKFAEFLQRQKTIDANSRWLNFGADKPGTVPAGTDGSVRDLIAYENAMAIVETAGASQQLLIGSLVEVEPGNWRATDVPRSVSDGTVLTSTTLFFSPAAGQMSDPANGLGLNQKSQQLLKNLEDLEASISSATPAEQEALNLQRAEVLEGLIRETTDLEERETWVRQYADIVGSAAQSGSFPGGLDRLRRFEKAISGFSDESRGYVAYRILTTDYGMKLNSAPTSEFADIQSDYLKNLEQYATEYPETSDAADAMVQLGLNAEIASDIETAKKWYTLTAENFPESLNGRKATGAIARLSLEKRVIDFEGVTLMDGKLFNTRDYRGKPIIVHYWATWCEPCKEDMNELKALQAKYAGSGLKIIGINLDADPAVPRKFLKQSGNNFPWSHLYDEGAFESKMAVGLGVFSLPVTIVIDGEGVVAKSATHFDSEIEGIVDQLINPPKK